MGVEKQGYFLEHVHCCANLKSHSAGAGLPSASSGLDQPLQITDTQAPVAQRSILDQLNGDAMEQDEPDDAIIIQAPNIAAEVIDIHSVVFCFFSSFRFCPAVFFRISK